MSSSVMAMLVALTLVIVDTLFFPFFSPSSSSSIFLLVHVITLRVSVLSRNLKHEFDPNVRTKIDD